MAHFTINTGKALCGLAVVVLICASLFMLMPGQLSAQEHEGEIEEQVVPADIPKAPTPIPVEEQQTRYTGEGTRDPFVSLLIHADADMMKTGLAAMKISEITVKGLQIGLGTVAMVQGTDGRAYNMKVGDVLLDGKVLAIDSNKVVFEKVVLDSFGRETDKELIEYILHR